jgi:alpha-methylacyl-CoA racemase
VPSFPLNLLADFAGGSLFATIGILSALYMRQQTGAGQFIDAAMVDGCISLMAMHYPDWGKPVLQDRGDGLVAGSAPYYRCYRCQDGRYIAVGALETRFFENLWAGIGYDDPVPNHMDRATWPAMTDRFTASFTTKPRDEWARIFAGRDACVTPVLDPIEALSYPHNKARHRDLAQPGEIALKDETRGVLQDLGLWSEALGPYAERSVAESVAGLKWPPL